MKHYLNKLPKEILNLIYLAQDISCRLHLPAYLVGGFVRDLILRVKNLDLDIVVEGEGIKFAEGLSRELKAKLVRHHRFGTATVILSSYQKIDISSARKELYPEPAHLPVVTNGTLKDDLFRRDFTINAMAISISRDNFGKLVDFFGGRADLDDKKIRILHELSFIDDPTRILRAIRFEARYNFRIEPKTLKELKKAAKLKILNKVQPQRTRDELVLMLKERQPLKEIRRLGQLTGFSFINRDLSLSAKEYKLIKDAQKEILWFKKIHPQRRLLDTWVIYFMALIDQLSKKESEKICLLFAFHKGDTKRILTFKEINRKFIKGLDKKNKKPSEIYAMLEPLSYEAIILVKAKYRSRNIQKYIEDFFTCYNGIRVMVSGHDLNNLGLNPGPHYQRIIGKVLNAKLNGLVRTKEEELALIKRL